MNIFYCEECKKKIVSNLDALFRCKFCKSENIKKLEMDLGKPKIVEVLADPSILRKISNQELTAEHFRFHQLYSMLKRIPKDKVKPGGTSVEDLVNAHIFVVEEMERRGLKHNLVSGLDRDTEKLRGKKISTKAVEILNEWGDITLVEDVVSVVGSTLYKNNPNDVDVCCKFSGIKIIEDAIKEVLQKRHMAGHIIYGLSHGEYVPKYDLVLKEKQIEKKEPIIKPDYKYIEPIKYINKTWNTEKFIVEPYINNSKRILIIRKDENISIYTSNTHLLKNESLIKRVEMIQEPKDFIYDGFLLKNGTIVLQDIIEKDCCNLKNDPLLSRKTFLIKSKIPREANIAFMKFMYCKSKEELVKKLQYYKDKNMKCIIKPAFSKYNNEAQWMKVDFSEPLKIDIGCGRHKEKGFIGIDKVKYNDSIDIVYDLEKGIPIESNSCSVVRANHFVEHLSNPQFIMEEVYRVLKDNGEAIITVPHKDTWGAKAHPEHKSFFDENSMEYYTNAYFIKKYQSKCYFRLEKLIKKVFFTNGIKRVHLTFILKAIKSVKDNG